MDTYKTKINDLREVIELMKNLNLELCNEVDACRKQLDILNDENEKLKKENMHLKAEKVESDRKVEENISNYETLSKNVEGKISQIPELISLATRTCDEKIHKEISSLQNALSELFERISDIQIRINQSVEECGCGELSDLPQDEERSSIKAENDYYKVMMEKYNSDSNKPTELVSESSTEDIDEEKYSENDDGDTSAPAQPQQAANCEIQLDLDEEDW